MAERKPLAERGPTRIVDVEWGRHGLPGRHIARCALTEGYSDESDLPKIIAIAQLPGGLADADQVNVIKVTTVEVRE